MRVRNTFDYGILLLHAVRCMPGAGLDVECKHSLVSGNVNKHWIFMGFKITARGIVCRLGRKNRTIISAGHDLKRISYKL